MKRLASAALLLTACATGPKPIAKPVQTAHVDAPSVADMTPAPGSEVASLDELAKAGDALLMHEVKRGDTAAPIAVKADADTCFRANVGASRAVRAWFADDTAIRGEIADHAGLVPPRGPVCARKGETLRLVVMAPNAATLTRAVVFASP